MRGFKNWSAAAALLLGLPAAPHAMAAEMKADVVVYGDASGGVTAAVQAARIGKSVILVSQYGHLGGLTASGLGWSDIGNDKILGGLSRDFHHRLYQHYQKPGAWTHEKRDDYKAEGQSVPVLNPKTELASTFEPKVAEAVFRRAAATTACKPIATAWCSPTHPPTASRCRSPPTTTKPPTKFSSGPLGSARKTASSSFP